MQYFIWPQLAQMHEKIVARLALFASTGATNCKLANLQSDMKPSLQIIIACHQSRLRATSNFLVLTRRSIQEIHLLTYRETKTGKLKRNLVPPGP
jgi:hypothetical protein